MNREAKLKKLKDNQNVKELDKVLNTAGLEAILDNHLAKLSKVLDKEISMENIEQVMVKLPEFQPVALEIAELTKAVLEIKNIKYPEIPKSIELKSNFKQKQIEIRQIENKQVNKLVEKIAALTKALSEQEAPTTSQVAGDFSPVRRVVKVGNRYYFDDNPTSSGGGGGSLRVNGDDISQDNPVPTTVINQNPLENYQLNDYTDGTAPNYYGYESDSGLWYIKKLDDSTSPVTVRYASGASNYANAWTNRATQTYGTFGATF